MLNKWALKVNNEEQADQGFFDYLVQKEKNHLLHAQWWKNKEYI